MFLGRHGKVCALVLGMSFPRDSLNDCILLSQLDGSVSFEHPGSHKWQVESSQLTDISFGMIIRLSFGCGVYLWYSVGWPMEIIWWCQGDVLFKSRAWTRYRDVLMEFSVNLRCPCWPVLLRNLCGTWPKDPRQQSSKPEKWKVHDISFSKHQKLLKNSSWAQSYDDLKKVRFFVNT